MTRVEYLLPFDTTDDICKDIESFNSLLSSNSKIKIKEDKIIYDGARYSYNVDLTVVEDKNCSVFHVTFSIQKLSDKFRKMLKAFRNTVGKHLQDNMQVIWDGVTFEWAQKLYPKIFKVENLMRKLISKFMLVNLGMGWHESSIPDGVKNSIRKKNYKPTHSILYQVDFIQLSKFLFRPYAIQDTSKLPKVISKILEDDEITEDTKEELEEYIPKNNWDRYFSEILEMQSGKLRKKWEKLYEIRCKIAHNRSMDLKDFEKGNELTSEVSEILEKALNQLSTIEIPEEDKEDVSLNTIASASDEIEKYSSNYLSFKNDLTSFIDENDDMIGFIDKNQPINSFLDNHKEGELFLSDNLVDYFGEIENQKASLFDNKSETLADLTSSNDFFNLNTDYLDTSIDDEGNLKLDSSLDHFLNKEDDDDDESE